MKKNREIINDFFFKSPNVDFELKKTSKWNKSPYVDLFLILESLKLPR